MNSKLSTKFTKIKAIGQIWIQKDATNSYSER